MAVYAPTFKPGTKGDPFANWGRLAFYRRWESGVEYKKGDIVTVYGANYFVALEDNHDVYPAYVENSTIWRQADLSTVGYQPLWINKGYDHVRVPYTPWVITGDEVARISVYIDDNSSGIDYFIGRTVPNKQTWKCEVPPFQKNISVYGAGDIYRPKPTGDGPIVVQNLRYARSPYNFGLGAVRVGSKVGVLMRVYGQAAMDHVPVRGENLSKLGPPTGTAWGTYGEPGTLTFAPWNLAPIPPADHSIKINYDGSPVWTLGGDVICDLAYSEEARYGRDDYGGAIFHVRYVGHILCEDYNGLIIPNPAKPLMDEMWDGSFIEHNVVIDSTSQDLIVPLGCTFLENDPAVPEALLMDRAPGIGVIPFQGELKTVSVPWAQEWDPKVSYWAGYDNVIYVTYQGETWQSFAGAAVVGSPPGAVEGEWGQGWLPGTMAPNLTRPDNVMEVSASDVWAYERYNDPYIDGTYQSDDRPPVTLPLPTNGKAYRPYNYLHVSPPDTVVALQGY